jgi:hypothetical protein
MAQSSGPIAQGTTAERQFTDIQWRDTFGDESGVIGDLDGTSYSITLGPAADTISVGSSTQDSRAVVAGFGHKIPQSTPESLTIPAASGSTRTDLIALRYDPAYTGLPGPVRLVRIAGSSSSIPAYDASPPGVEELPLFAITRAVGGAITAATLSRQFPRLAPVIDVPSVATLPTSSPLGTIARIGTAIYHRRLNPTTPAWVLDDARPQGFYRSGSPGVSISAGGGAQTGIGGITGLSNLVVNRTGNFVLNASFRAGNASGGAAASGTVLIDGSQVGAVAVARMDGEASVVGMVTLSAGSHTIALREDASGGTIGWTSFNATLIETA